MTSDSDDDLFLKVAQELARNEIDQALWTKAFSLEDGDEKKTKAHYIRLRVEKLRNDLTNNNSDIDHVNSNLKSNHEVTIQSSDTLGKIEGQAATPWARFCARSIDYLICYVITLPITFSIIFTDNVFVKIGLSFAVSGAILILYDAILISMFGATIGKGIAGIRVRQVKDGSLLNFNRSLKRAIDVWVSGNGLYMFYPVATFFMWYGARKSLLTNGVTSWDDKNGTTVELRSRNVFRLVVISILGVMCFAFSAVLVQLVKKNNKQVILESDIGLSTSTPSRKEKNTELNNISKENQNTSTNTRELLGYEKRAWSGNMFDQFDTESVIEKLAKERIPQMSNQRVWQAVKSWQMNYIQYFKDDPSPALYKAVDDVLEGLKGGKGVCVPSPIYISKENAPPFMPDGGYMLRWECDNEK